MRTCKLLWAFLLGTGLMLSAQEKAPTPVTEVGLNYSLTHFNPGGSVPSFNANGASGTIQYNFNKALGIVGDFGGYRLNDASGVNLDTTSFTYMGGPRFTFRKTRFNPYVQALFGGTRLANGFDPSLVPVRMTSSENIFTTALGGGVNFRLTDHIYLKPAQVEYLLMRFPTTSGVGASTSNYNQNNMRFSAGVVFGFGSK